MATNAFPIDRTFLLNGPTLNDLEHRLVVSKARPGQLADALSYEDLAAIIDIRDRVVDTLMRNNTEAKAREEAIAKLDVYKDAPAVIGKLLVYGWTNDYNDDKHVIKREDFTVPLVWLHNADSQLLADIADGDASKAKTIISDLMPDVATMNPFDFNVADSLTEWLEAVRSPENT